MLSRDSNISKFSISKSILLKLTCRYNYFVMSEPVKYFTVHTLFDELDTNKNGFLETEEISSRSTLSKHTNRMDKKTWSASKEARYTLLEKLSNPKFKFLRANTEESAFLMVTSDISALSLKLSQLKSSRKKFICLNDNLEDDISPQVVQKASALTKEFLSFMFPNPSKFEK